MKKIIISVLVAVLSPLTLHLSPASACTNYIVGKKASADGSVICSYSADSYGMFQGLVHYPAAKHPKGTMRQVYDWDTNKYGGEILEAEETYNVTGNINEWQVTIGETTLADARRWSTPLASSTTAHSSILPSSAQRRPVRLCK